MIWLDKILAYRCYHVISFKPEKCFAESQRNHIKIMLWVHYLEANKLWSIVEFSYLADIKITQNVNDKIIVYGLLIRMYQKPINNDLVVIVLRNLDVSWTAKFNN